MLQFQTHYSLSHHHLCKNLSKQPVRHFQCFKRISSGFSKADSDESPCMANDSFWSRRLGRRLTKNQQTYTTTVRRWIKARYHVQFKRSSRAFVRLLQPESSDGLDIVLRLRALQFTPNDGNGHSETRNALHHRLHTVACLHHWSMFFRWAFVKWSQTFLWLAALKTFSIWVTVIIRIIVLRNFCFSFGLCLEFL